MRFLILPIVAVLLTVGCAATSTNVRPQQEKEFVTGSNIARKDRSGSGVTVLSKEAIENAQNSSSMLTK